jgi:hypothetical protein
MVTLLCVWTVLLLSLLRRASRPPSLPNHYSSDDIDPGVGGNGDDLRRFATFGLCGLTLIGGLNDTSWFTPFPLSRRACLMADASQARKWTLGSRWAERPEAGFGHES